MKVYYLIILFLSLNNIYSLYTNVDPYEKKCLTDYRMANSSFSVIYFVSGQEEEDNLATIEDNESNVLLKAQDYKNHSFNYVPENDGEFKFCFENTASTKVTLSFEFDYGFNDYSMISIHTIENFVNAVDNLEKKLKKLQFNIRNSAVRKKTHFTIAESIRKKINIYAFIKIGFLILFTVFQLMMITSIFSNVKVVKQINVNSETRPLKSKKPSETTDFL